MEGLKSFSVLHVFNVVVKVCILSQIWKNMRICVFKGVNPDYYNITWRGSSQFITTLQGGGVYRGPIFVLRNKGLGKTSAQINQTSPVTTTRAGSKLKWPRGCSSPGLILPGRPSLQDGNRNWPFIARNALSARLASPLKRRWTWDGGGVRSRPEQN